MREGRVHPSQTSSVTRRSKVSSCTRWSKASSMLRERVKLAAEKAAMVAEVFVLFFGVVVVVFLLEERGSLEHERLR